MGLDIKPEEVVLLLDSGYDAKEVQKAILSRGWSFIISLKSSRNFSFIEKVWTQVKKYFEDGRRPWKTIRIATYRGKKRKFSQFSYKHQVGFLKGVRRQVKLVCSKRPKGASIKYLVCSEIDISAKSIISCYRCRWKIGVSG